MSRTTGRRTKGWSFDSAIEDAKFNGVPGTGQHRANLIDTFRKHLKRRFK